MKPLLVFKIAPLFFILIFSSIKATSQWMPVQGMDGANVRWILTVDSVVFISAEGRGMLKRNISSNSWSTVIPGYWGPIIKAGNYIVGYYPYNTLYRSQDMGQTWQTLSMPTNFTGMSMTSVDTSLFIPCNSDIMRSDDYGDTWYSVVSNIVNYNFGNVYSNGSTLFCNDVMNYKIYKSTNLGISWDSLSTSGLPGNIWYMEDIYSYQSAIWTTIWPAGIYRYNNLTNHWDLINDTLYFYQFGEFYNVLYGCSFGVYQLSTDLTHWIKISENLDYSMAYDLSANDSILFCATECGVFKTNDSLYWHSFNDGLHGGYTGNIAANGSEVWVPSELGLYKSMDGGASFNKKSIDQYNLLYKIEITDSVYFLMDNQLTLYNSTDFGESWININLPYTNMPWLYDFTLGSQFIFISKFDSLYSATYSPFNWNVIPTPGLGQIHSLVAHDSNLLIRQYPEYNDSPLRISHDNGNTFDTLLQFFWGNGPFINYIHNKFFVGGDTILFKSADEGYTWESIHLPQNFIIGSCVENDECLVITGYLSVYPHPSLIYISYDQGLNWTNITDNLQNAYLNKTGIAGNFIFISTNNNGLWYRDDLLTGIKPTTGKIKDDIILFPNPASGRVNIKLKENAEGIIRITDMFGRTVYDSGRRKFIAKNNTFSINTGLLPDGLYVVTFYSDQASFSRKLQIIQ